MFAVVSRVAAALLVVCIAPVTAAADAPRDPGKALYEARCASCHADPGTTKAPSFEAMKQMSLSRVFFAMVNGSMKTQAAGLSFPELGALATYASAGEQKDYTPAEQAMCKTRDVDTAPVVGGWAFDETASRSLSRAHTSIDATNVAKLELAWAFGLPGTTETRSQPVATADTLFVGASSGHVFALDRKSGCVKWHTAAPLRTSLMLGTAAGKAALIFGDSQGYVTALAAADGTPLWRSHVGLFDTSMLSGTIVQTGSKLIVPISSVEVGIAATPTYECCKTHGGVSALDADTGKVLWTTHFAPDAVQTTKSPTGVQQWGPSGVPVWSTPTIDAKRGLVYVGTGENYSAPATDMSDSIVALDLESGAVAWHFQAHAGDTYNSACDGMQPGPNCPSPRGPDFDFGAAVAIVKASNGKELLLAGQKSGDVWALDPDANGKVVWNRQLGAGSALGGVHWGIAVADGRVFVPISDPPFPLPGYEPKPGLYALDVDDGAIVWSRPTERGCTTDMMSYFGRTELYPACSFYFGLSAAPTALPGVIVAGGLDGKLRAFAADDGAVLWEFATVRDFEAVNGVEAHGGSIDAAGAIAVGDMLYVQSGYSLFAQLPGNALLAFRVHD